MTRALFLLFLVARTAAAAADSPAAAPNTNAATLQAADVAARLDGVQETLRQLRARADDGGVGIRDQLAAEREAIERLAAATRATLDGQPALMDLQELERQWTTAAARIAGWSETLSSRVQTLQRDVAHAHDLRALWRDTARALKAQGAPPALLARIQTVLAEVTAIQEVAEDRLDVLLDLQSRVGREATRAEENIREIRRAREDILGRLLVRDSPTLLGAWLAPSTGGTFGERVQAAAHDDANTLLEYLHQRAALIPTWIVLLAGTMLAANALRRSRWRWDPADASTRVAMRLLERPFSVALVVWIFLTPFPYGGAPRLLIRLIRVVFFVPVVRIVGPTIGTTLRPFLYGLLGFALLDEIRGFLEAAPALERTLLAVQCAAGATALFWLPREPDLPAETAPGREFTRRILKVGRQAGLLLLLVAVAANVLGYVRLARLLYVGTVYSAYAGAVTYTLAHILEGLVVLALHTRAAEALHLIQRHRQLVIERALRLVRIVTMLLWCGWVLHTFAIADDVLEALRTVLRSDLPIGQVSLSIGDLVSFAIALWAAFLLSRLVRVVLEDEFFPRMRLGRGVPYAVATFSSYTVLLVGFFIALAAAGIGFDRLTVVAGALGVGVGFGLQNVVNNFVSGLILLFERPIQIGDIVQLGDVLGTVRHIGLRSSTIRTYEGAEIIVPNANLIAQQVINWTLSDHKRRVDLAVGVAYGTDPEQVIALLVEVARQQPDVLDDPPPGALFMGFGDSALTFELRAWTANLEDRLRTRSALAVAVNRALIEAGVEIPFPQRDLHIRGLDTVPAALPLPPERKAGGT